MIIDDAIQPEKTDASVHVSVSMSMKKKKKKRREDSDHAKTNKATFSGKKGRPLALPDEDAALVGADAAQAPANAPVRVIEPFDEVVDNQIVRVSIGELAKVVFPYAFISYGGPLVHLSMFNELFVVKLKWIDQEQYDQLISICQTLPGPAAAKLLLAIGSIVTESFAGGLVAACIFAVPSALVMLALGLWQSTLLSSDDAYEMPHAMKIAFEGFQSAAVAVAAQAAWLLSKRYLRSRLHLGIIACSAVLYKLLQGPKVMVCLIVIGCAVSWKFDTTLTKTPAEEHAAALALLQEEGTVAPDKDDDVQPGVRQRRAMQRHQRSAPNPQRNIHWTFPFGWYSLATYLALLFVLAALRFITSSNFISYFSAFYMDGSLIIGGTHVLLPLLLTQFKASHNIDENAFWNGYAIASAMPGPLINFSAFVGALVDGLKGGIFAWIGMFMPAFLLMWGLIPTWDRYRNNMSIKKILLGMGATCIGFILVALVTLQRAAAHEHAALSVMCSALSFVLLVHYEVTTPLVILFGGIFFYGVMFFYGVFFSV